LTINQNYIKYAKRNAEIRKKEKEVRRKEKVKKEGNIGYVSDALLALPYMHTHTHRYAPAQT
jgi:hypothetical protein